MARANSEKKKSKTSKDKASRSRKRGPLRWLRRWALRVCLFLFAFALALVALFSVVNPPITHTILTEKWRLGEVHRHWVDFDEISPAMARSVVAAEDANFCLHWGFDVQAIRAALSEGGQRGGSTITQQVVKNVFLWQDRSWFRKAVEAGLTPMVEAVWSKQRILEVYLNVAETGLGVFGVEAAARRYFAVPALYLDDSQAAQIAAILPSPRTRSVTEPTDFLRKRARSIADGAATIAADGRAACFED